MTKTAFFLATAVSYYAAAASLRGDGVEEVGEQIENFPPEDHVQVDRRRLVQGETTEIAGHALDEWPDQDIMGHVVEDEDEIYVEEWRGGEEELDGADQAGDELVNEWPVRDIVGSVAEDEETYNNWSKNYEDYDEDVPNAKEYTPDPGSVTLIGTDLMGEPVNQNHRREAQCDANESEYKIMLKTDNYAYETKWKLINLNGNQVIGEGPPKGINYADDSFYSGRWCLPMGQYKFQMIDNGSDGICSNNAALGCGMVRLFLNGQNAGRMMNDKSDWRTKDFPFVVGISSRIDGVTNNNNSNANNGNGNNKPWCEKVRSVMNVPQGTCTLPNGRQGHRVRVTTKVDKFGKETSWQVTRKSGNQIKMKMGPVVEANSQESVEDCLPAGEYNLAFQDLDGVCCRHGEGFFKLIVDGKELLAGGRFTKSIDHDFQLGFDWISSMSDRDCEWWWAHDHRRRDWHTRCYEGQYCNKTYRHLKWSPALRADAQEYADRLLDTCEDNGIKHDATEQGENLAKNRGSGTWGAEYSADKVTKRFVDNEEFWGWNRNAHLTQAMWYPTRYMGCAESVKNMGGTKMCRMQVCRYAKAGNCQMSKFNSATGNNWMTPMMMDDSPCGPMCASSDGCYH